MIYTFWEGDMPEYIRSWTPKWYKALTNPLDYDCTLSNFLREALNGS